MTLGCRVKTPLAKHSMCCSLVVDGFLRRLVPESFRRLIVADRIGTRPWINEGVVLAMSKNVGPGGASARR